MIYYKFVILLLIFIIKYCEAECIKTEKGNCLNYGKKYWFCIRNYDVTIPPRSNSYDYSDRNIILNSNVLLNSKCIKVTPYRINAPYDDNYKVQPLAPVRFWLPGISKVDNYYFGLKNALIAEKDKYINMFIDKARCGNGYNFFDRINESENWKHTYIDINSNNPSEFLIRDFKYMFDYRVKKYSNAYYETHKDNVPCIYFKEI